MAAPKQLGAVVYDTRHGRQITWRIVNIKERGVDLSGPGPCRGMKDVSYEEFNQWWEEADTSSKMWTGFQQH